MGKKNKRSKVKKKSKQEKRDSTTSRNLSNQKTDDRREETNPFSSSQQKGILYRRYKAATNAVIQWALSAIPRDDEKKMDSYDDDDEFLESYCRQRSLRSIVSGLWTCVHEKQCMPYKILTQMDTAIRLRRQVSRFYQRLVGDMTMVSEEDYDGHAWIIDQLDALYQSFYQLFVDSREESEQEKIQLLQQKQGKTTEKKPVVVSLGGFAALAVEEEEEESDDDTTTTAPAPQLYIPRKTPKETQLAEEQEERALAIAFAWMEIDQARDNIKKLWIDWASTTKKESSSDKVVAAADLLAVTSASRYAVHMVEKLVSQTCLAFDLSEETFLEAISSPAAHKKALNQDGQATDSDLLDDLGQIYKQLKEFQPNQIPDIDPSGFLLGSNLEQRFSTSLCHNLIGQSQDRPSFLATIFKVYFPIWIRYAEFGGNSGVFDATFRIYIREYKAEGVVRLKFCFLLLALVDSSIACIQSDLLDGGGSELSQLSHKTARQTLMPLFSKPLYNEASRIFEENASAGFNAMFGHYANQIVMTEIFRYWMPCTMFFPWITGDILMLGLEMAAKFASDVTALQWKEHAAAIHIYSMLRREGFVGRIAQLEQGLIQLYHKRVWFRSGVPYKSKQYMSAWQMAMGSSAEAALQLQGIKPQRHTYRRYASTKSAALGLNVEEMSALMRMNKFEEDTSNTENAVQYLAEIQKIARDECRNLFTQPMLETSLKLHNVSENMVLLFLERANEFAKSLTTEYWCLFRGLPIKSQISFWALGVADGRAEDENAKQQDLSRLAQLFAQEFNDLGCVKPEAKGLFTELEFNNSTPGSSD